MVLASSVRPHLEGLEEKMEIHWHARSGHLRFPKDFDLGCGGELGLEAQVFSYVFEVSGYIRAVSGMESKLELARGQAGVGTGASC